MPARPRELAAPPSQTVAPRLTTLPPNPLDPSLQPAGSAAFWGRLLGLMTAGSGTGSSEKLGNHHVPKLANLFPEARFETTFHGFVLKRLFVVRGEESSWYNHTPTPKFALRLPS